MNNLKQILTKKGISQKWLAEQLKVTTVSVNNWCQNRHQPSLKTLERIAKILDVKINKLI